ncbi:hypothetical protein BDW59DRAFT_181474 [Aspergillus cavernicola]|uniref:ER membrane protein complex subunit 1 C-terminal domain-containing protein n=1 Tax=Aspergillus cavernicola TaxID=176166 RepID=A0ABR4HZH1_9EURO
MSLSKLLTRSTARAASTSSSASASQLTKAVGDISSVFPSLRPDYKPEPLPARFQELKERVFRENEDALKKGWERLLPSLEEEVQKIKSKGSDIIPSVEYSDVVSGNVSPQSLAEIRHRGSVVVRNVLPRAKAREYKERIEDYVAANYERVKAFPPDSPAVFELYWTPSQAEARAHANMLETQRFLQRLWHSSDPNTRISTRNPLSYADRLRIRQPGDSKFTLGPHVDGGSLERWEDPEYSQVYKKILQGKWEEHDPWDVKHRITANMDLYNGAGACSMLRFFQGWLSMSKTAPGEGSLHVCPMLVHSTAYTILRPFFDAQTSQPTMDATFPGSVPGACQEYNPVTHPHLELETTMVSVPEVEPGDFVAWHCDSLHSVDKEHRGTGDSSVLYIPATPMCDMNVDYLIKQRKAALAYSPPWDFPGAGGHGELGFKGALDWNAVNAEGQRAMGLGEQPWEITNDMTEGEKQAVESANKAYLRFSFTHQHLSPLNDRSRSELIIMWLQAALLLVASCVPSSLAIFPDEVGHVDFHHALLGVPSSQSTFFHRPSSSSNAALLYTVSDKSLLGAVNPKDGSLLWRQNLTRSAVGSHRHPGNSQGLLRTSAGTNAIVSALGDYVSAWSAQDGKLIWENWSPNMPIVDLELLELDDTSAAPSVRDAIALSGGQAGSIKRLDGSTGEIKWEHHDENGDIPLQVSSSSTDVFYISLQSALLKGYKIRVTSLDLLTGRQTQQQVLNSESDVSGPDSVLFVGANTAFPVIAWADKSYKTLKINVIGTKQITTVNIDNTSGQDIKLIHVHAPKALNALPHFLVQYETASSSWAEVYHVDLQSSTVSKAYSLPYLQGWSVFATGTKDANVYFTRITDSETTVVSSASHGILGRWSQHPPLDRAVQAVSEVAMKGDSVAVRSAVVLESGDWQLIQNGAVGWTRPEALSGALAASWADVDIQKDLAHQLEVEGHESLYGAYMHRVERHLRDLQHLPDWLKELPKRILTSILADEVSNLDGFGVSKPVIVATKNGRVYALDSGNHGKVSWSVKAAEADSWNVKAILTQSGSATVYADDGSSVTLDITSGSITQRQPPTGQIRSVAVINDGSSPSTIGINEDGEPVGFFDHSGFFVTQGADGRVLGWSTKDSKSPVWEFLPASGEKIICATARPSHDPVASIGKVLGNRSVLYKYLTPNAALITAVGETSATFYLLDAVTGRVLHTSTHKGVDTAQPIASTMSENWFAYSFYGEGSDPSDARGYQLVISEMYESPIANDRGPLGAASNYSALTDLPLPHVISQSFIISEPISHMAVTQTRQGITTSQLLATLPESNAIIGIPRPILDPRRPIGRDPTSTEAEEGLMKYTPFLDFDGRWYLTHARQVAGINTILSEPTLLESTSLIFAFGNDIFATRATPSQAFDILSKGFSKLQLLMTIVALAIGVSILAPIARKKKIDLLWKTR